VGVVSKVLVNNGCLFISITSILFQMLCVKCGGETGGAKFCPIPTCGELQPGGPTKSPRTAATFNAKSPRKAEFFEQKIKDAAPKEAKVKKTWKQGATGGDMYGTGKYKQKTQIEFAGPPPEKKTLSDLP